MKLELNELYIVKTSIENQTIKAADAMVVSDLLLKINKEFERLQKIEQKKQPAEAMEVAK
jgi:hypothetical protein